MLLKPIVECAGTDISHWFNPETGEVRTHIDPVTGCVVAYTPKGRFLHIPPPVPRTDWSSDVGTPWWKDMEYCIGNLTSKTRALRVVNILSSQEQLIEVCTEESMNEIQKRYMTYNTYVVIFPLSYRFPFCILKNKKTAQYFILCHAYTADHLTIHPRMTLPSSSTETSEPRRTMLRSAIANVNTRG